MNHAVARPYWEDAEHQAPGGGVWGERQVALPPHGELESTLTPRGPSRTLSGLIMRVSPVEARPPRVRGGAPR